MTDQIKHFFQGLTNNQDSIELAVKIQQAIEEGHTAINYHSLIKDDCISDDGSSGYLVIKGKRAGFRRFYNQETILKNAFCNKQTISLDKKAVQQAISSIINNSDLTSKQEIDWQWQACLSALTHKYFILDGGPGTGKTTTIVRLLLLYIQLYPDNKIMLAAPTGKAANRMSQSLNQNLTQIDLDEESKSKLQIQAKTIHRLLGYNPKTNKLKFNKNQPLSYDLIIIDESSMLDVSLSFCLVNALKDGAQLIFIGDKNQLPAVDAGNVFADLCTLLAQDSEQKNLLTSYLEQNNKIPNSTNYVKLIKNYRFKQNSIVAKLCNTLTKQDVEQFNDLKTDENFHLNNPQNKQDKLESLKQWYDSINLTESKIILCATNKGTNSVTELNELAKAILHNQQELASNTPIIVNKNDYNLDVYNGDMGTLQMHNNQWHVPFIIEGKEQLIQLQALNWQIAHAISIHKSQGSEYDHVLITLSENIEQDLLTNALLYTAISRAKKSITLWANDKIIAKTIKNQSNRLTFLK